MISTTLEVNTYYPRRPAFSPQHPGYFITRLAAKPVVVGRPATLGHSQGLYHHAGLPALYDNPALPVALFCLPVDKGV